MRETTKRDPDEDGTTEVDDVRAGTVVCADNMVARWAKGTGGFPPVDMRAVRRWPLRDDTIRGELAEVDDAGGDDDNV